VQQNQLQASLALKGQFAYTPQSTINSCCIDLTSNLEKLMTKPLWTIGLDVIVTDSTSECYGQVGHIVRISSPGNSVRLSVDFEGNVFGFDQDDIEVALI
jgi:hypothetical protein